MSISKVCLETGWLLVVLRLCPVGLIGGRDFVLDVGSCCWLLVGVDIVEEAGWQAVVDGKLLLDLWCLFQGCSLLRCICAWLRCLGWPHASQCRLCLWWLLKSLPGVILRQSLSWLIFLLASIVLHIPACLMTLTRPILAWVII